MHRLQTLGAPTKIARIDPVGQSALSNPAPSLSERRPHAQHTGIPLGIRVGLDKGGGARASSRLKPKPHHSTNQEPREPCFEAPLNHLSPAFLDRSRDSQLNGQAQRKLSRAPAGWQPVCCWLTGVGIDSQGVRSGIFMNRPASLSEFPRHSYDWLAIARRKVLSCRPQDELEHCPLPSIRAITAGAPFS